MNGHYRLEGIGECEVNGPVITCSQRFFDYENGERFKHIEEMNGVVKEVYFKKTVPSCDRPDAFMSPPLPAFPCDPHPVTIKTWVNVVKDSTYGELLDDHKPKYISQTEANRIMDGLKKEIIRPENLVK